MNRLQMLRNSLAERKNILIVGSGLMAETLIDHLLLRPEVPLTHIVESYHYRQSNPERGLVIGIEEVAMHRCPPRRNER
jgi:hypothetical protein